MEKQRNLAIDILKVLAALMITNSHLKPLYIDPFTPLGTFGAPGNALFFFISGYGLCLGRWSDFNNWYSRRISRIIPSLIMWFGLLAVPFYYLGTHSFQELLFMSKGYWFIRCIFIYYLLYYIVRSFRVSYKKALLVSFIVSVLAFFIFPHVSTSIYASSYHYVCFLAPFFLGCYMSEHKIIWGGGICTKILLTCICLCLFYAPQFIGKGKDGLYYSLQIISYPFLIMFIICAYNLAGIKFLEKIYKSKYVGLVLRLVSQLTLEIYLTGRCCLLIGLNKLFPVNLIIQLLIILVLSVVLKILANLLLQVLRDNKVCIKNLYAFIK